MDDDGDRVYAFYGLSEQFPTEWEDLQADEREFEYVLGHDLSHSTGPNDTRTIQRNFDIFVKMKSAVDTAYVEMRRDFLQEQKKWGVASIELQINSANKKAAQLMKPIMDNKVKGDRLKATLSLIEKHRYLFDLPATLKDSIRRGDNDSLVRDYRRGRALTEEIRTLPSSAELTDYYVQQRRVIERIWEEVESVVEDYKREVWRRLSKSAPDENFLSYISLLLELGVEDNPIWIWLRSQVDTLTSRIDEAFSQLNTCLLVLRQDLADTPHPITGKSSAAFLKVLRTQISDTEIKYDTPEIITMWSGLKAVVEEVSLYFSRQISLFWTCAAKFLDGQYQKTLPEGPNGESKAHLTLSPEQEARLRSDGRELVELFSSNVSEFFLSTVATATEHVVLKRRSSGNSEFSLPSPDRSLSMPADTASAKRSEVVSLSASAILANSLKFDKVAHTIHHEDRTLTAPAEMTRSSSNMSENSTEITARPASPVPDTNFDTYAFLPPNANAISATYYLSQILGVLGTVASELAGLSVSYTNVETLRTMLSTIRERCINAACLSWRNDATRFKMLEDWQPTNSRKSTKLPGFFMAYQMAVLEGLQRVVYIQRAEKRSDVVVIMPPSSKLVSSIKTQFVNSIFLLLDGLVKDAVKSDRKFSQEREPAMGGKNEKVASAISQDSRLLLMICNLTELQGIINGRLFDQFSSLFLIQLTDKSNMIGDSITQLDGDLFDMFVKKRKSKFSTIVRHGILKSGIRWSEQGKPSDVSPYIYLALLQLVHVHAQVVNIAPTLVRRVILNLLQHMIQCTVEGLRQVDKFSLGGMLQATIDVQFIDQKMGAYITQDIANLFQSAYKTVQDATDREHMDIAVMTKHLGEMKKLLIKCHKSSRLEFMCFRDEKPINGTSVNDSIL
ncbi:exocyst complex component Sec5-domain-containing protein [Limtongia smithiae]|uniref:exocyst complex component Sec5-domain-containing protein n=1 Tax=Limtongia smithiae TaxID=1125753 RepID=UPI0034CF75D9